MHRDRRSVFALISGVLLIGPASAQIQAPPSPAPSELHHDVVPAGGVETPGGKIEPIQKLEKPIAPSVPDAPSGPKVPTGVVSTAPRPAPLVNDPPTPTVQLQIRTPAHVAVGKPVPYKLTVMNNSGATAYRVQVRVPMPDGAKLVKCEPAADTPAAGVPIPAPQLMWSIKSLPKGESKTFDLEFQPAAGANEIRLRGHVSFEHGAEVVTAIAKPKLTVKKSATPTVAQGELVTVRVEVLNAGAVPIPQARLVETVPPGVDFKNDKDSEKGEQAHQRIWQLGTLEPGQAKIVTYQLLGKKGGDLLTTSMAASDDKFASVQSEHAESKTKVLVPALKLDLTGPATVAAKESALYTARVQNTGTQPLDNVRVTVALPDDCEVTKVTTGARRTKDQVAWTLPKLPAGEAHDFRVTLESPTSGKKQVKAAAKETRTAVEDAKEVTSTFQGRADLTWKPEFEDASVNVGKQGLITVKVKNQGTETDKGLRLRVELPPNAKFVEGSPKQYKEAGAEVIFEPRPIAPNGTETFTVTYEAKQAGPAYFRLRLEAESLGDKPLLKEQVVQINNAK